jgi:hypothetical protein
MNKYVAHILWRTYEINSNYSRKTIIYCLKKLATKLIKYKRNENPISKPKPFL